MNEPPNFFMRHPTIIAILSLISFLLPDQLHAKPLKVFILAGQSNMEGSATIGAFDYIGDDPATAPMFKMMRGVDGKLTVCGGAWISYLTGAEDKNFALSGKLSAGYGSIWGLDPTKPGDKIGPEFTFALMGKNFAEATLAMMKQHKSLWFSV